MSSALLLSPLTTVPLTFFDTETTGLYAENGDRICEIALVRTVGGKVVETFDTLVYPERSIPAEASKISGIDDNMVWGKPRIEEVASQIEAFVRDSILVAHNAPFDLGFLQTQLGATHPGLLKNLVLDTLVLARRAYPSLKDHTLGGLASAFRVEKDTFHRALGDSLMTSRVFQAMMPKFVQLKLKTVGHLLQYQGGSARPSIARPRGSSQDPAPATP